MKDKKLDGNIMTFKPSRAEVVRKQKLIIRPKIILSRDEIKATVMRIEASLENDPVVMLPEWVEAFTVDQDCVVEVYDG